MLQFIWLITIICIVLYILYHIVMFTIYRIKLTNVIIDFYWEYTPENEKKFYELIHKMQIDNLKIELEELNKYINK